VLQLIAIGLKDREIAVRLGISVRTAEKHVEHIFRKLRARNRLEAARIGSFASTGLLPLAPSPLVETRESGAQA